MERSIAVIVAVISSSVLSAHAADPTHIHQLLQRRQCSRCDLTDADLVHADLRNADLYQASLQRANLSAVNLDGAKLQQADLSFTSLNGASLRGADLRGSYLYGTDFRQADLSGARFDPGALEQSHWQGAKGIAPNIRSHAALHNAGVDAAQLKQWRDAEDLFTKAIEQDPQEPLSWVARAISRGQQGKEETAARDLAYAGTLYEQSNDVDNAELIQSALKSLTKRPEDKKTTGNNIGSSLITGAIALLQSLGPLALKSFIPLIP